MSLGNLAWLGLAYAQNPCVYIKTTWTAWAEKPMVLRPLSVVLYKIKALRGGGVKI